MGESKIRGVLIAIGVAGLAAALATGCQSNDMDRDLKRQADRSTIQLMKVEKERDSLRQQVASLQAEKTSLGKTDMAAIDELAATRKRNAELDAELKKTRSVLRQVQDELLSLKTNMPAPTSPK